MRKRIHSAPSQSSTARDSVAPKYVGIWIDRNEAQVMTVQEGVVSVDSASAGQSGSPSLELDVKRFYRHVAERIRDVEELVIAGPAECRDEFRREFIRHAPLSKRLATVRLDDSPSPRHMRAKVKRFFEARRKPTVSPHGTIIAV